MMSPEKFVKPADLFKMRRSGKCKTTEQLLTTQSPMKCLNNFADPSPTKNLPVLLKNPFRNQPVKRRLNLGSASNSPIKRNNANNNNNNNSNQSSPRSKSPTKRNPKLEMDEDANMEAPRFKLGGILTPRKRGLLNQGLHKGPCYQNDWTLRTKVKITFATSCKNWSHDKATTHKRHSGSAHDEDTPSKVNDKTISLEAIKNAATVYQHPYLSWLPLFPRCDKKAPTATSVSHRDSGAGILSLTKHSEASKMMHLDWCESLNDLLSLVGEGKCPFFYLCADNYNILFKHSNDHDIQAHISPISNGMRCALQKEGIQILCDDDNDIENSQSGFEDEMSEILGDLEGDDDDEDDDDASQFLESLNIPVSQQDFPTLYGKSNNNHNLNNSSSNNNSKTPNDNNNPDSNSQSNKWTSQKQLATIQGRENIKKLEKFLQTNRLYTISKVGDFACIPPTLLSPREFRLSTPRYPDVVIGKHFLASNGSCNGKQQQQTTPNRDTDNNNSKAARGDAIDIDQAKSNNSTSMQQSHVPLGLKHVELRGIVLPNLFRKLHKLLTVSDNSDHTCSSIQLDSAIPFKTIHFSSSC